MKCVLYNFALLVASFSALSSYGQREVVELKKNRWVNEVHVLRFLNDSLVLFSGLTADTSQYIISGDSLQIFYELHDVRNNDRWPHKFKASTTFRFKINDDSLLLYLANTSAGSSDRRSVSRFAHSPVRFVNLQKFRQPHGKLISFEIATTQYLTSAGTTDTSGNWVKTDTTSVCIRFHLSQSGLAVTKSHIIHSRDHGQFERREERLETRTVHPRHRDLKNIKRVLADCFWLFKVSFETPGNNHVVTAIMRTRTGEQHLTSSFMHPLLYDAWRLFEDLTRSSNYSIDNK